MPIDAYTASHVVIAHFAMPAGVEDTGADPTAPASPVRGAGELVATYTLGFADGTVQAVPVRRRFEINDLVIDWGHLPFAARPHRSPVVLDWRGPHADQQWFRNQQTVDWSGYTRWMGSEAPGNYWIHAIPITATDVPLTSITFRHESCVVGIAGVTLFNGTANPLRHERRRTLQVRGPGAAGTPIAVDLGIVGHRVIQQVLEAGWTDAPVPGWGSAPAAQPRDLVAVDVTASPDASLSVGTADVPLGPILAGERTTTRDGGLVIEALPEADRWVRVHVVDDVTGLPTSARIHLRTPDGRYLPPYGHRHEINDRWFEDYGADCLLGATPYAYVPGAFDVELPTGDVLVEAARGFDTLPVRTRLSVDPATTELTVRLGSRIDRRASGWISADTHVHFLSPDTALLEAKAEDVQIVNLLAAQWGDLYTNVGDYTGRMARCSDDDAIVWVGTENRQHFLGHINLLGRTSPTTGRMATAGPPESLLGDPVQAALADWAQAARAEGGLAIVPHFPVPYAEVVADAVLGHVDALEVRDFQAGVDSFAVGEYYRLLNAGVRVAIVGGTDKMSAGMPLGGVRTYARVGDGPISFHRWADAVRAGRTMTSTGPFIHLTVDGIEPGGDIHLPASGGTLEVQAVATAPMPLRRLQVIYNGNVVAEATPGSDPRQVHLSARIAATRDGWIAARCDGPDTLWHTWPVLPAAHTSPVYLSGPAARDGGADVAYLQTILDGGLTWMDTLATTGDAATARRIRAMFLEARAKLGRRT